MEVESTIEERWRSRALSSRDGGRVDYRGVMEDARTIVDRWRYRALYRRAGGREHYHTLIHISQLTNPYKISYAACC